MLTSSKDTKIKKLKLFSIPVKMNIGKIAMLVDESGNNNDLINLRPSHFMIFKIFMPAIICVIRLGITTAIEVPKIPYLLVNG